MIKVKDNENFNEVDQIKFVNVFESDNEVVFKGSGENLKNYRIYGNTVSGESVGDRTGNLFNLESITLKKSLGYGGSIYTAQSSNLSAYIQILSDNCVLSYNYTTLASSSKRNICFYNSKKQYIGYMQYLPTDLSTLISLPENCKYIRITLDENIYNVMLNTGSEPLPYEPYGYRVPVTVTNGTDTQTTNIYLPEQIRKVGDEAEYIDYKEQKLHKLTQKAPHTATLQLHYGITFDPNESWNVFDAPEALYYAEDGLAAGTYNFTIQEEIKGTPTYVDTPSYVGTYQFTLTKNVPPGGQLTLRPSLQGDVNLTYGIKSDYNMPVDIRSYANALSTTPIEEVVVVKGNGGISLGVANGSAQNLNHIGKAAYGSNNYMISTIRQYINSSASTGNMWKPQTKYDRPEFWVSNVNGFMNDIDSTFLNSVGTTKKIVANSNGEYSTSYDKFFLLSQSEVYGGYGNNINEGEPYSYYSNYSDLSEAGEGNDSNRIKKEIGWEDDIPIPWYLRTCSHLDNISYNGPFKIYAVEEEGDLKLFSVSYVNSFMIVPACNIALDENYAYNGQVLHVRDQITVTKGDMTLIFDVIDIDHDEVDFYSPNSVDIEIPAITTSSNTNTLSVNTSVKPSKVWGRLSDSIDIEYVKDNLGNILFIKTNEIEGELPLNFKGYGKDLKNYRIYGNTVSGESVGDRTGNLFDINSPNITKHHYYDTNGIDQQNWYHDCSEYIRCKSGVTYTLSFYSKKIYYGIFINLWNSQKQFVSNLVDSGTIDAQDTTLSYVFTPNQDGYITFNFLYDSGYMKDIMLNEGSMPLPYEPYGYRVAVTAGGVNIFDENYEGLNTLTYYRPLYVGDGTFTLSTNAPKNSANTTNLYLIAGAVSTGASYVNNGVSLNSPHTVTSVDGYVTVAYRISGGINPSDYHAMLNKGSSALPYKPYSEPVTTNIYLPEQISKVGNVTEYIDYREQKQYFADGTSADVTLPALPTLPGTNTLSVGTEVQPSNIYLKGKIKEILQ